MKIKALIVLSAIILVSRAAAAAETGTLVIRDNVVVNGTQLSAGEYKVKWEGNGAVDVTILRDKKAVATTKATVKELKEASRGDSVIYKVDNNTRSIAEVQFGGKKAVLVF